MSETTTKPDVDADALQKRIAELRKASLDRVRELDEQRRPGRELHTLGYEEAKLRALETFLPEQLIETEVAGIGECLFRWPDEVTYNHFMKGSGAIKGDLAKMTIEVIEDLVARCALYPAGMEFVKRARQFNPHSRTVLAHKFLASMGKRLDDEGK